MRLIEAEVSGYKRLAAKSVMDLDGDLICVIGPNGAGKSSFLDALVHLTDQKPFEQAERTRDEGGVLSPALRAKFVLDDDDRKSLSEVPEAAGSTAFEVFKNEGGLSYRVEPAPKRDLTRRDKVRDLLDEFYNSPWLDESIKIERELEPQPEPLTSALVSRAREQASLDAENLDANQLPRFSELRERLRSVIDGEHLPEAKDLPKKYQALVDDLEDLVAYETVTPHSRAIDALVGAVPRFAKFEQPDRELKAEYDLNGESDPAIENLLVLAGSSWAQVVEVIEGGDKGRKNVLLEELNAQLKTEFRKAWGQTPMTVKIDFDGMLLTVMMSMQANDYINIDQHSDGLLQFVALRAFVALHGGQEKPVVLVDEAETHLHYDAQADLVGVFEEQEDAVAIIYTTHSAGCLPRDIGLGLRAVVPIEKEVDGRMVTTDHSRIINEFWFGEHGFTPMLMAMGASALAISAAQKALVTEGFTDALLLPTLLREATESPRLEYQVVPHFARAHPEDIPDFDLLAARVAYLVDGDQGGEGHIEKLEGNGVLREQIVVLGGDGGDLTLEDLIAPEVLIDIFNQSFKDQGSEVTLSLQEVPETRRVHTLAKWCEAQSTESEKIELPSKSELASALIARRKDRLVDPGRRESLQDLDSKINEILATATARLKEKKSEQ